MNIKIKIYSILSAVIILAGLLTGCANGGNYGTGSVSSKSLASDISSIFDSSNMSSLNEDVSSFISSIT